MTAAKIMCTFLEQVMGANSSRAAFALAGGVALKVWGFQDRNTYDVDICVSGDLNPVLRGLLQQERYGVRFELSSQVLIFCTASSFQTPGCSLMLYLFSLRLARSGETSKVIEITWCKCNSCSRDLGLPTSTKVVYH